MNTTYRMEFNYDDINKVLIIFKDTLIFKGGKSYVANSRNLRIWVQKEHEQTLQHFEIAELQNTTVLDDLPIWNMKRFD